MGNGQRRKVLKFTSRFPRCPPVVGYFKRLPPRPARRCQASNRLLAIKSGLYRDYSIETAQKSGGRACKPRPFNNHLNPAVLRY